MAKGELFSMSIERIRIPTKYLRRRGQVRFFD